MDRVLVINSGLKHSMMYVEPYLKRLNVYLNEEDIIVDVRNIMSFDERTVFAYDTIVFFFLATVDSLPSTTLEIFEKLENIKMDHQNIYSIILCDEYETENCDISEKIVSLWAKRKELNYKGSLKIGSSLVILKTIQKYPVCTYLKMASKTIANKDDLDLKITLITLKSFMKKANRFWVKQMIKKQKEVKKMSR